jgi:hypothetical protein
MKHTSYKLFWAWEFEKEEKWLNEMSAKGFQLVAVGPFRYVFDDAIKGNYQYKLELLDKMPSNPESVAYIRFLEETGAEHVGSLLRWVYFRKKTDEGSFELYSDIDSKIKHYKRIITLFLGISPLLIVNVINNLNAYLRHGLSISLIFTIISALLVFFIGRGAFTIHKQIQQLKKEKLVRE